MLITVPLTITDHCLLKEGQDIDFETPFLKKKTESEVSISIAKNLNVSPQKIFHYLKKFVGETIEKDETLAVNKGIFSTKKIISKYSGLIKEINHSDGTITILSQEETENTVNSFFNGKVNKIKKNEESNILICKSLFNEEKNILLKKYPENKEGYRSKIIQFSSEKNDMDDLPF